MARAIIDLTGREFDRLKVIGRDGDKVINGSVAWVCECKCGEIITVPSRDLIHDNTRSCGCLKSDHTKSLEEHNRQHQFVDGVFVPLLRQKLQNNSTTGIKGVSIQHIKNGRNKYIANITVKGERHYLGVSYNLKKAMALRKSAEEKYFKPYLDKYELKTCAAPDCDIKFKPAIHNQEYHEPKCRFRHNKQILRQRRIELGLCPQCGGEMDAESNRKHCTKCKEYYKSRRKVN